MIWIWILQALKFAGRLVLPAPAHLRRLGRIDPNSPCPACGNCKGALKFVRMDFPDKAMKDVPMVQHVCATCHCSWCSKPVSVPEFPVDLGR